jgi:hypothetical protein
MVCFPPTVLLAYSKWVPTGYSLPLNQHRLQNGF